MKKMRKRIVFVLGFIATVFLVSCVEDGSEDGILSERSDEKMSYAADGFVGGGSNGNGGTSDSIEAGQITAGEWNDLEEWTFWKNLVQNETFSELPEYWDFNLVNRISVLVKDDLGNPFVNAKVQLLKLNDELLWESKTDYRGSAELWSGTSHLESVKLKIGDNIISNPKSFAEGVNVATLNSADSKTVAKKIDIAFVVDATGSMADELEYLKVELIDVIDSVKETNGAAQITIGSVFYRDEGDDYITKKSDFSTDINKTVNFIKAQSADGGGDFPEAVHSALDVAINDLQWSDNARSRILFLMLDAPPHYDPQVVSHIHTLVEKASKMGIKIIPITASGINNETEFLMRYFSVSTNSTYVFITGHSGIGGEHLEPTVGEYQVELLNHLLVRLINKYLN